MELLKELDWKILVESIEAGNCILVLGPDVAIDPDDPKKEPLRVRLARKLAEGLRRERKDTQIITDSDLYHVAQIYVEVMPTKHYGLEIEVEEFYAPYSNRTTPLHRDLASLPFSLCISTTPDRFLFNAFSKTKGKIPFYDFYHFEPDPSRARQQTSATAQDKFKKEKPLIYDLYGSLKEKASLVLTENDLLDFLANVIRQTPQLHPQVTSRFSDPSTSFLFIGFGFRQWYMRILLHVMRAGGHKCPSIAIEDASFFKHPDQQHTLLFFSSGHLIKFCQLPWHEFSKELRHRFSRRNRSKQNKPALQKLADDAPIVFLCHENRDKQIAEKLREELHSLSIKTWLDVQNLRGGDNWEKLIPDVLKTQTNYVVVLQSHNMLFKEEGYFWKEIRIALERQKGVGTDLRFLIPVILEHHEELPLKELKEFHTIDLTKNNIQKLANNILEDWHKRQSMREKNEKFKTIK